MSQFLSDHRDLIKMVLRLCVLGACLSLFYNKVDARDLLTLAAFFFSDGAIGAAIKPKAE